MQPEQGLSLIYINNPREKRRRAGAFRSWRSPPWRICGHCAWRSTATLTEYHHLRGRIAPGYGRGASALRCPVGNGGAAWGVQPLRATMCNRCCRDQWLLLPEVIMSVRVTVTHLVVTVGRRLLYATQHRLRGTHFPTAHTRQLRRLDSDANRESDRPVVFPLRT